MNVSGVSVFNSMVPVSNTQTGQVIDFDKIMTPEDKALFKAATGYDLGAAGHNEVPRLAVTISLARAAGFLKGPVTQDFLKQYSADVNIGINVIKRAIAYLNNKSDQGSRPARAISFTA